MGEKRKESIVPRNPPSWKVWKKIKLGTYRTHEELMAAIKAAGIKTDAWTSSIVGKVKIHPIIKEIELYRIPLQQIGIKYVSDYNEVRTALVLHGFKLVPTEVIVQSRLQYLDQPKGELLNIGSVTFPFLSRNRAFFALAHDEYGIRFIIREPHDPKGIKKTEEIIVCR